MLDILEKLRRPIIRVSTRSAAKMTTAERARLSSADGVSERSGGMEAVVGGDIRILHVYRLQAALAEWKAVRSLKPGSFASGGVRTIS